MLWFDIGAICSGSSGVRRCVCNSDRRFRLWALCGVLAQADLRPLSLIECLCVGR